MKSWSRFNGLAQACPSGLNRPASTALKQVWGHGRRSQPNHQHLHECMHQLQYSLACIVLSCLGCCCLCRRTEQEPAQVLQSKLMQEHHTKATCSHMLQAYVDWDAPQYRSCWQACLHNVAKLCSACAAFQVGNQGASTQGHVLHDRSICP